MSPRGATHSTHDVEALTGFRVNVKDVVVESEKRVKSYPQEL
jgi:hypothetical protein